MSNCVEFYKLFYTPLWRYQYPDFHNDFPELLDVLTKDELYITDREKNGLQITTANLHKDKRLNKLRDFMQNSLEETMSDLGYLRDCGMTSMWATRQKAGGFHHQHSHKNSFLGGVFHFFDSDKNASGTVFVNDNTSKYVIVPAVDKTKEQVFQRSEHVPFIPGTFVVFPAWLQHYTIPTECNYRIIVACNSMPIGMTNTDHFDRYNFSDPSNMIMKEYDAKL